jgi:hypothetical protein
MKSYLLILFLFSVSISKAQCNIRIGKLYLSCEENIRYGVDSFSREIALKSLFDTVFCTHKNQPQPISSFSLLIQTSNITFTEEYKDSKINPRDIKFISDIINESISNCFVSFSLTFNEKILFNPIDFIITK